MDNKKRDFLLEDKFIEWRLLRTDDLNIYWETFIKDNPELSDYIYIAIEEFNSVKLNNKRIQEIEKKEILASILYKGKRRNKMKSFIQVISTIAAVAIVGLFISLFIKLNSRSIDTYKNSILGQTMPDEEVYIISNNNKTRLADNSSLNLTQENKAVITNNTGKIAEVNLTTSSLNRIVVPYGKRSTITLSDGSKVWLNSGTQLDFPTTFTGETREISVNGEIYIEVEEDKNIPFIVNTKNMAIQVYGTSFNVTSYNDDENKSIVLVKGKVGVRTSGHKDEFTLKPNEMISLSGNEVTKENVNVYNYISWTQDILVFDETPISEILKKVGRYYNVQFDNLPEVTISDKTCSGKLFLSNNLDSVMMSISSISSTKYERNNNIINITKLNSLCK